MRLRTRVLAGVTALVLVPLLALAAGIRWEMRGRLTEQSTRRVEALVEVITAELARRDRDLGLRLAALRETIADDDRIRLCLVEGREDLRPYLLDYAGRAMALMGLDLLQVQDRRGRIVSSGHFRNEYDRVDAETIRGLAARGATALLRARRPEGPFLALARVDSLRLGQDPYYLVAGWEIDARALEALSPEPDLTVTLVHPGGVLPPGGGPSPGATERLVRAVDIPALPGPAAPHFDAGEPSGARLLVTHSLAPGRELLRSLDRWLGLAWLIAAAGSVVLALRLSAGISRPIEDLARCTAEIDLDRLEASFPTDRTDEVGTLSRFLAEMIRRMRSGVARLRETERRATRGELARQVNHDLRNAFTPLRNVVRHLSEVAARDPELLPRVYRERRDTLDAGLEYLEQLAGNWARMSVRPERVPCDLPAIVRQVSTGRLAEDGGPIRLSLPDTCAPVLADPVGLRRVVENLVANSCESLEGAGGTVEIIASEETLESGEPAVRLVVRDDGPGIPPDELDRIFDHFYTTKEGGSGLGLSIVRRLVTDFEGHVRVTSSPGKGTEFLVTLPAASVPAGKEMDR